MFGHKQALPVFEIAESDPNDPLAAIRDHDKRREMYNVASDYIVNHSLKQPAQPAPVLEPESLDWQALLGQHIKEIIKDAPIREVFPHGAVIEDTSDRISAETMAEFARELGLAFGASSVTWVSYDDEGNPVFKDI